ncbi:MAG: hypothetical protein ABS36_10305 [Acidobacteria bacterium SCN 69-37]|nr:MAG: hypothetical protein ABS36_10305 [Acidobacteria bacterium SCN 69-37]
MSSSRDPRTTPASFSDHAEANLRFIRQAMERSSAFTAVPGLGGVGMGVVGLAAAPVAAHQPSDERWLVTWLVAAVIALAVGATAIRRKAARNGAPLTGPIGRRFGLGLAAPLVVGAAMTYALWRIDAYAVMAPMWLLLYGAGVIVGGLFSAPVVRIAGACYMAAGLAAIVTPSGWGTLWLALGFGGLQIGFGLYIARRLGG